MTTIHSARRPRWLQWLASAAIAGFIAVPTAGIAAGPDRPDAATDAKTMSKAERSDETPALKAAERYRSRAPWNSTGRGDTLKLKPEEADAWYKRPVVTRNGELVGHVAAVRLSADGTVEKIAIQPDEIAEDAGRIAVDPGAFTAEAGKIVLAMNSEQIRSHGKQS